MGAKAGVKKLIDWWNKKAPIKAQDESHTLLFSGSGESATLVMRSSVIDPLAFLKQRRDKIKRASLAPAQQADYDAGVAAITTAEGSVKSIHGLQKTLKDVDNPKSAKYNASTAQAKADELDGLLKGLAATIGQIIGWFRIKDGKVKRFSIPSRRRWMEETQIEVAEDHQDAVAAGKYGSLGELRKVKGHAVPFKLNRARKVGRRHIVSSHDMARHYADTLADKPISNGKLLLEQRGTAGDARIPVPALDQDSIETAAKERHARFFNYAVNLWIGNQRENSRKQERRDPRPDMSAAQADKFEEHIKRAWALDGSFKASR